MSSIASAGVDSDWMWPFAHNAVGTLKYVRSCFFATIEEADSSERRNTVSSGGRLAGVLGLPETDVARVQRWCRARVPEHVREEVRVDADVAERHVTIVECRPSWQAEVGSEWTRFPIARLRYTQTTRLWSLYWRDRNLKFHAYDRVAASASVEELLAEIDRDPTAIFWG